MVGIQVDRSAIDRVSGNLAQSVERAFDQIDDFKMWLDTKVDGDLTALGYSVAEVADLRSAYGDLAQLSTLYRGTASLGVAKDFRTFVKRLWGFGF